jgi:hypothetical protein
MQVNFNINDKQHAQFEIALDQLVSKEPNMKIILQKSTQPLFIDLESFIEDETLVITEVLQKQNIDITSIIQSDNANQSLAFINIADLINYTIHEVNLKHQSGEISHVELINFLESIDIFEGSVGLDYNIAYLNKIRDFVEKEVFEHIHYDEYDEQKVQIQEKLFNEEAFEKHQLEPLKKLEEIKFDINSDYTINEYHLKKEKTDIKIDNDGEVTIFNYDYQIPLNYLPQTNDKIYFENYNEDTIYLNDLHLSIKHKDNISFAATQNNELGSEIKLHQDQNGNYFCYTGEIYNSAIAKVKEEYAEHNISEYKLLKFIHLLENNIGSNNNAALGQMHHVFEELKVDYDLQKQMLQEELLSQVNTILDQKINDNELDLNLDHYFKEPFEYVLL